MKKMIFLLTVLVCFLTGGSVLAMTLEYDSGVHSYTGNLYDLFVDGKQVSTPLEPIIFNDRALVPVREVMEAMGAAVDYKDGNITITQHGISILMQIGNSTVTVSGEKKTIPDNVAPKLIAKQGESAKTMVPVRFISETLGYGREVIGAMTDFITKLSPLFAALMVSAGAVTSAAAFHPVLSGAVYLISVLVEQCFVPLAYFGAILGIAGKISPRVQISNATRLIRSVSKWMMTAALTLFTGITALYGFSAPVLDGVAVKTVKFAVGSFVPVVGGLLADTVETVLSGTKLMKNAVGTAGILAVAAICIVPVLKIFVMHFMLRLCAAAAEPLTDRRISEMLSDLADSVMTIYIMVLTVCMLFTICIGIIMSATT